MYKLYLAQKLFQYMFMLHQIDEKRKGFFITHRASHNRNPAHYFSISGMIQDRCGGITAAPRARNASKRTRSTAKPQ